MRRVRVANGAEALPHVHISRWDSVVHIVQFTEGASEILLDGRGTPIDGSFRFHTWCERSFKMHLGGNNRITRAHPTCVRCVGALQCAKET
jgi:hypothetical protein